MTLKQRLAELMPHFDDDGKLLPNKKLNFETAALTMKGGTLDLGHTLKFMLSGADVKIEDAPKRPREVWVTFDRTGPLNVSNTIVPTRHDQELIRFIEDTPREVTDADAEYYWDYYKPSSDEPIKQAFKRMLQHYENERNK